MKSIPRAVGCTRFLFLVLITLLTISSCASLFNSSEKIQKRLNQKNTLSMSEADQLLGAYNGYIELGVARVEGGASKQKSDESGNEVTLAWKQPEPVMSKKVQGYKIYFGTSPKEYNGNCVDGLVSPINIPATKLDDPLGPAVTIRKLESTKCYFSVASYNEWGESSGSEPIEVKN